MEINYPSKPYDKNRYGMPWIARARILDRSNEAYALGNYIENNDQAEGGILRIEADRGDIIVIGQKDLNTNLSIDPSFFVVTSDGDLLLLGNKVDIYRQYFS